MGNVTNNGAILVLFILLVIVVSEFTKHNTVVSGYTKKNTKAGPGIPFVTTPSNLVPAGTLPQPTGSQPLLAGCMYNGVNYSQGTKLCLSNKCHQCSYDGTWSPTGFTCGINSSC